MLVVLSFERNKNDEPDGKIKNRALRRGVLAQCSGHEFANAAQWGVGGGRAGQTYALVLSSVGTLCLVVGTCLLLWSLRRNNKKKHVRAGDSAKTCVKK